MSQTYFQKGLGLKAQVAPILEAEYGSGVVDRLRELGYAARAGATTLRLAREFGFCYGVDRAVEYAYETRQKFPGKRLFLSGEIIHNPDVNERLAAMGYIQLDPAPTPAERYAPVTVEDVVLLPAFGVTQGELSHLRDKGCVLIDTTCGSVLNVWKNVKRYAQEGFTVVIHGKHYHEETRATASQALEFAGGQYLCVRNLPETDLVCAFIRDELPASTLLEKLGHAAGPGFEPDRDLQRIGLANQTTMLMSESLEVQERLRQAMKDRHGEAALASRFRAFDTICSATQDRQDAVVQLLAERAVDLMVVIGGYNSSNTQALAKMCADKVPTYHIDSAACVEAGLISHRAVVDGSVGSTSGWLPAGPLRVGLTAGASTPNSVVAAVVERVLAARGQTAAELVAL